jgi:uncharacterized protein YndB with AHSA1/START domain
MEVDSLVDLGKFARRHRFVIQAIARDLPPPRRIEVAWYDPGPGLGANTAAIDTFETREVAHEHTSERTVSVGRRARRFLRRLDSQALASPETP